MTVIANMPYSDKFSFADIGYMGVSVPNGTGTPVVAADAGKALTMGTGGFEVAGAGEAIMGFLADMDADNTLTMQVEGFALCTMATDAVAVGDYCVGAAGGTIGPNGTSGSTTASNVIAFYKVSSTSMWVKML